MWNESEKTLKKGTEWRGKGWRREFGAEKKKKKKNPKKNGKSRIFGCVVLETLTAFATATHCTNSNVTTSVAHEKRGEKNFSFSAQLLKKDDNFYCY